MKIDKQFVFIIGAPRSGTTWLLETLTSHPEIASVNVELTIFDRYISPLVKNYELKESPDIHKMKWGLADIWSRVKFDDFIKNFIDDIYSSIPQLQNHKLIIDKQPEYSLYVDLIHYYIPTAKFIHVIRDGRDVAYSWNRITNIGSGNSDFHGACMDWVRYKNSAKEAQKFPGENYIEIKYENLLLHTQEELIRILRFCNIDTSASILEQIISKHSEGKGMTSYPDPKISFEERITNNALWKTKLSKEQKYIAKITMGNELILEKYETTSNWGLRKNEEIFFWLKYKLRHYLSKSTLALYKHLLRW